MLSVASTVMIFASFLPPTVRYCLAHGPDMMLNISSLATSDSPFVAIPVSGSSMGATERAQLMKDEKVRFGDVSADADVGRLAIGTLGLLGMPNVEPVRRKRFYM
jgi:hypothetical protein